MANGPHMDITSHDTTTPDKAPYVHGDALVDLVQRHALLDALVRSYEELLAHLGDPATKDGQAVVMPADLSAAHCYRIQIDNAMLDRLVRGKLDKARDERLHAYHLIDAAQWAVKQAEK